MSRVRSASWGRGVRLVFELALGQLLSSRRTLFMLLGVCVPVILAVAVRTAQGAGAAPRLEAAGGAAAFGTLFWTVYLWFLVPVLGVFYGTALIADEVEGKTLTYLFTRPLRRGAILAGKYAAYLVCASLMVLPSVMVVYFVVVPLSEIPESFAWLLRDLGLVVLGLAAYGGIFALAGAVMRRPLLAGLLFVFGWEPLARVLPGYLSRATVAYYLQGLVPHAMPPEEVGTLLLPGALADPPSAWTGLAALVIFAAGGLWAAMRAVERREYVLGQ